MRNFIYLLLVFIIYWDTDLGAQNKINSYEYWFDSNYATKVAVTLPVAMSTFELVTTIPTNNLNPGLHTFNIRFRDSLKMWSIVESSFFQKLPQSTSSTSNKIIAYEYWQDSDYTNKVFVNITPSTDYVLINSPDFSTSPDGLHTFNIRFKDQAGLWSSVISQFFQKNPASALPGLNNIIAYEYWMDSDYSAKIAGNITPGQNFIHIDTLSTTLLNPGLHTFNIRYKDQKGMWSSVISQFFQKNPASALPGLNNIIAYEYWMDSDYSAKIAGNVTSGQNFIHIDTLSTTLLNPGLHTFNIRYKDQKGMWSSVVSQFIQKLPQFSAAMNLLTGFEYWMDQNYSNKVSGTIAPTQSFIHLDTLNFSSIMPGLHTFNIRYKDQSGQWSTVLSQFIQRIPQTSGLPALITGYRYWFDLADTAMITINLPTPINPYNLITNLDLKLLKKGNRVIHFQFKDTAQLWSVVVSDTFYKSPTPIAMFSTSGTVFCDSGTVTFTNNSHDAELFFWNFGDNTTSTLKNPVKNYSIPGTYLVKLVITDTILGLKDSITSTINIDATPIISLGSDTALCQGQFIILNAGNPGLSYLWSTNSTNQSITVSTTGSYNVKVTSNLGCSYRDTIYVLINPLPQANVGSNKTICKGLSTNIGAPLVSGNIYLWSSNPIGYSSSISNPIVAPIITTTYFLKETITSTGCFKIDSVLVTVLPIPNLIVSNNQSICLNDSVTITATGGDSYLWSNSQVNASIKISPIATQYFKVTASLSNGCSKTDSVLVTVKPLPMVNLGNDTSICSNSLINLNAGAGHSAYLWHNNSTAQTFPVISTGTYWVKVTGINACQNSDTISIIVKTAPSVFLGNDTTIIDHHKLILNAGPGFDTYQWSTGATSQTIQVDSTGVGVGWKNFWVIVGKNGCYAIDTIKVSFIITGLPEVFPGISLQVFPNPTSGIFYVRILNLYDEFEITLFDVHGKLIFSKFEDPTDREWVKSYDYSGLPNGIYLIKVSFRNENLTTRIIKQ